jgi:hypothetical protein
MATSENNIIDNAKISRGAQGERGAKGETGATGAVGATGPAGAIGPSGESKMDINLQFGENPYAPITANYNDDNWDVLAFFLYPGTGTFTPEYIKLVYSIKYPTGTATTYFRVVSITAAGVRTTVATFNASETNTEIHNYKIGTSTISGLPTTETVFALEASIDNTAAEARGYAIEMR